MTDFLFTARGKSYLVRHYVELAESTYAIAEGRGTYANLVRRALIHHGIPLRSRGEAQRAALAGGRHEHPTRGRARGAATRERIGEGVSLTWGEDRDARAAAARRQWAAMTAAQRERLRRLASQGVSRAARDGSALERLLAEGLARAGHRVRTRDGRGDLTLPLLRAVVFVDGPSHLLPLWGEARLARVVEADAAENARLLAAGLSVVRVRCPAGRVSATRGRRLLTELLSVLDSTRGTTALAELEVT